MKKRRAEREAANAAKAAMAEQPPPNGSVDGKATKADTGTRRRKRAKAATKG